MSQIGFRKNKGFTLIEIILVVLILVVIAGVSIPNFRNSYQNMLLRQSAEELAYVMRYAQSRAITFGEEVFLRFNDARTQYWLLRNSEEDGSGEESEDGLSRLKGKMGRTFDVPDAAQVTMEGNSVRFHPNGRIERKEVRFCDERKCYHVSANEIRGRVQIYEKER